MANKTSGKKKPASPMPVAERAKQFAPFAALKGLSEALAKKERIPVPRREISDDQAEQINRTLLSLQRGEVVTAVWYDEPQQDYTQMTGVVSEVDLVARVLRLAAYAVPFADLADLIPAQSADRKDPT